MHLRWLMSGERSGADRSGDAEAFDHFGNSGAGARDPVLAAAHFNWLVTLPVNHTMLSPLPISTATRTLGCASFSQRYGAR